MEKNSNWLNFLKLRGSWGQNGNCNISNFQYLATIAFNTNAYYYDDKGNLLLPVIPTCWRTRM